MELKIEKGVPISRVKAFKGKKASKFQELWDTLAKMDIQDSIFLGNEKSIDFARFAGSIRTAVRVYESTSGRKFTTRAQNSGLRVWRTK